MLCPKPRHWDTAFNIGDEDELVFSFLQSFVFSCPVRTMATGGPYQPALQQLDLNCPAHLMGERWRKWKRSFNFYVAGQAITGSARKHSLLLHLAGPSTQDFFETLKEPTPAVEDRFERTIKILDDNFKTAKNTHFERHCFRHMAPNSGETTDQFVARLRLQAQHCDFMDVEDKTRINWWRRLVLCSFAESFWRRLTSNFTTY